MLIAAGGLYKILRWRPKCSQTSGNNMSTSCLLQCRPSSLLYCSLINTHITTKKENLILTQPTLQARHPACYGGGGPGPWRTPALLFHLYIYCMYHGHTKATPPLSKRPNIRQLSPVTFLPLCFVVGLKSHGCMF